jgi:hypothetical protein
VSDLASVADKQACGDLIRSWGAYRDQRRWAELLDTFTADGTIAVSWFRGSFADFVERCRSRAGAGTAKHLLFPSLVRLQGARALVETNVVILVRQHIEGIEVDLTSYARFADRLVKSSSGWRIAERAAIYEKDRLDAVEPGARFAELLQKADSGQFPAPCRYMAYRIGAYGGALATPIYADGTPDTAALLRRYEEWLLN